MDKRVGSLTKWLMAKNTIIGIVGIIIIVAALYADFSYWAGTIKVEALTPDGGDDVNEEEPEELNYTLEYRQVTTQSGSGKIPSPGTGWNSDVFTFDMPADGALVFINLSYSGGSDRTDYDLFATSPSGKEYSSAGPGGSGESIKLEARGTRDVESGSWTVTVQHYMGCLGSTWTVDVEGLFKVYNATS